MHIRDDVSRKFMEETGHGSGRKPLFLRRRNLLLLCRFGSSVDVLGATFNQINRQPLDGATHPAGIKIR